MLDWSTTLFVVMMALAIDALGGDPDWLWRRAPHPVVANTRSSRSRSSPLPSWEAMRAGYELRGVQ